MYREDQPLPEPDRSILVVGAGGEVIGVDRWTGATRWVNQLPGGGTGEVFIGFRYGVLVVSSSGDAVYRLDYASGATIWASSTASSGRATILVEPEVIVVAKGGKIDTFDHNGRLLWQHGLPGMGFGSAALGFPGNVAQADDPGRE